DSRFLECFAGGANIRRLAEVEMPARSGPETTLVPHQKELAIANDDTSHTNVRNLIWDAGVSHRKRSLALTRIRRTFVKEGEHFFAYRNDSRYQPVENLSWRIAELRCRLFWST